MKALIIDDEPHVRTVARLLVDWDKYDIHTVLEAGSAEEARDLIHRETPAIILSDINLPSLSGLDLIEELRAENIPSQVILITAYGDFAYAQRAVRLGCVDYLLKPLSEESLNEAVAKAVRIHEDTKRMKATSDHQTIQRTLSLFLSNLPASTKSISELCDQIPAFRHMDTCVVAMIGIKHLPADPQLRHDLMSVIQDHLAEDTCGAVTAFGEDNHPLLLLRHQGPDTHALCRHILHSIQSTCHICVPMGVSDPSPFPERLSAALQQSLLRMVSANLLPQSPSIHCTSEPAPHVPNYEWISQELGNTLFSGHTEYLPHILNRIANSLLEDQILSIRELENFRTVYNSIRTRCVLRYQREHMLPAESPVSFRTAFFPTSGVFQPEYFVQLLLKDLKELEAAYSVDISSMSTADLCRQIHLYLENHFQEDISLDHLALRFSLSPGYLSRSYKREMGIGLIDDLTMIRLEEAKRQMAGPLRTSDIAAAVGFSDPKYFSRVFKKVYRQTPAEYRESLRGRR